MVATILFVAHTRTQNDHTVFEWRVRVYTPSSVEAPCMKVLRTVGSEWKGEAYAEKRVRSS